MQQNRIPGLVPPGQPAPARIGGTVRPAPSVAGRANTADQIRPASLQPTARPVDTFVRPQAIGDATREADSLLQSLSVFSGEVSRFMANRRPRPEDSVAAAQAYIQQNDPGDLDAAIASGQPPAAFQNLEGMQVYAENLAYRHGQELARRFNEEYVPGMDVDSLIAEITAPAYEMFGNDRAALGVYTAAIEQARRRLTEQYNQNETDNVLRERRENVFGAWMGRTDAMLAEGSDPAAIVASIGADLQKNQDFLLLSPTEQGTLLLQVAAQQASKGNLDVAEAILTAEFEGDAFTGSLVNSQEFGEQAQRIISGVGDARAEAALASQASSAEQEVIGITDQMWADGLVTTMTDAEVPDGRGGIRTISRDRLIEDTARRQIEYIQQEGAFAGRTDDQIFDDMKRQFVTNGVRQPDWFNAMEGGWRTLGVQSLAADALPPAAVRGFQIFRRLEADSADYLGSFLPDDAMKAYSLASALIDRGWAATEEEALRTAGLAFKTNPVENIDTASLDTALSRLENPTIWPDGPSAVNGGYAMAEIKETAQLFMRAGLRAAEAVESAQAAFTRTHFKVEGAWLRRDPRVPSDFPQLAGQYLDMLTEKYGSDGEDVDFERDDLTLVEAGNGTGAWVVLFRGSMSPLRAPGREEFFTLSNLDHLRAANRARAEKEAIEAAEEQRERDLNADYIRRGIEDVRERDPIRTTIIPDVVVNPDNVEQ